MSGFGKDLKENKKTTTLYRKVNFDNFLNEGELCFSTSDSVSLSSHGEFCLILEEKEYNGLYTNQDADAGKNFGYDEFRIEMTREELIDSIDYIVVPNEWIDSEDKEYDEGEDPFDWIENLSDYGRVIGEREYEKEINFNF